MAFIGVQYIGAKPAVVDEALAGIAESLTAAHAPGHWDRAEYVDEAGYVNVITAAYWQSREAFKAWLDAPRHRDWWEDEARCEDGIGYFREIFLPRAEEFETIFSHRHPEGVSHLAECMSGEVFEHGYWGSSRDRIARSQVSDLEPSGFPVPDVASGSLAGRVRVTPQENLCLIRSGQDWTETGEAERDLYLSDVLPPLSEGMLFLRDEGHRIGCYNNRFMTMVDQNGSRIDKSYSLSMWRGLAELERWAESHPTHLAIFVAAIRHYSHLRDAAMLRVYHEVSIVRREDQIIDYINCHSNTGFMKEFK
jgi:aldoxime dehydratase